MKKILCLFLSGLMFVNCTKEDETETKPTEPTVSVEPTNPVVVTKDLSFKILTPPTTERFMNNIQVGEVIYFTVEITDDENKANTSYVLSPVVDPINGTKKHQNNSVDYNFNSAEHFKAGGNSFVKELSFKEKKMSFGVKVLKPGTFQNVYQIQKFIDGQAVGKPVIQDLLFNAVIITAEAPYIQTDDGGLFDSSNWRREYYFRIDCGNQEFDNYTRPSSTKKSISYETFYQGGGWAGPLNPNNGDRNVIRGNDETEKGPAQCSYNLDFAKIFIEYTNGTKTIIEYKNIPVTEYRFY
jgi:hypothetical protein